MIAIVSQYTLTLVGSILGLGLFAIAIMWYWSKPRPRQLTWSETVTHTLAQETCWRCGAERVSINKTDNPVITYDCGTKVYIDMDIERIVNILGKDCHRKDTP